MKEVHNPGQSAGHDPKKVARVDSTGQQPNDIPCEHAPPNEPAHGREQDAVPVDGETVIDPPPGTHESQHQPIQG